MFKVTPVASMIRPRLVMDTMFNDRPRPGSFQTVWSRNGSTARASAPTYPLPIDVFATHDEIVIVAAAPGIAPDQFDVSIHEKTVLLSGTVANRATSDTGKTATWFVQELWSGTFRRAVNLPFEVDADRATATWEHGVVRITLPRAEQARPKRIPIHVGEQTDALSAGSPTAAPSDMNT